MARKNARTLYGSTDRSSCVPSALRETAIPPLGNLAGQYLADALTVWECYANAPAEGAPLLLRFEEFDLALYRYARARMCASARESHGSEAPGSHALLERTNARVFTCGNLAFACGAVDTSQHPKPAAETSSRADGESTCPAWVPEPSLACLIGQQVKRATIVDEELRVEFEECVLRISCEGEALRWQTCVFGSDEPALGASDLDASDPATLGPTVSGSSAPDQSSKR